MRILAAAVAIALATPAAADTYWRFTVISRAAVWVPGGVPAALRILRYDFVHRLPAYRDCFDLLMRRAERLPHPIDMTCKEYEEKP